MYLDGVIINGGPNDMIIAQHFADEKKKAEAQKTNPSQE